ncbi:DUF2786 domain-containing protein [Pseudonocardia petroleophila]|uniref:DUF2786 domain-containing protein n=1 Tax=Pseudonocardia petroleophila TaxID=37331 RepID=A0A7G7MDY4_9PSEU|nr:DUF2786 domain-containing protein [Pseudonocardia petroleophila]QNG50995.1 DUF2786 domain-containing protein [Pseudonocardia petroleophila]
MGADKLDTIRKLLAKADGAATVQEADAYTAKAVQLMARHGIDDALLGAADPGHDEIGATRIAVDDPYSAGKARLLGWVGHALGCRCVLHGVGGGRVTGVTVFGHASDRARVEVLHTSLLLQATAQLVRLRPPRTGESVAAYRRSWLHGFAVEVHRRITAAREQARHDAEHDAAGRGDPGPSVALVLADRHDRVERAWAEAFPDLGRARRTVLSGSGLHAGMRAGARADLGHHRVAPARAPALGR